MVSFFASLIFLLGYNIYSSANWVVRKFGEVTYEQIMFHLNMPFASESLLVINYCKYTILIPLLILLALFLFLRPKYRLKNKIINTIQSFIYNHRLCLSLLWFVFACVWFFFKMNVWQMITFQQHKFETSNFYEQYYVKPQDVKFAFPKHKKNLILIFAESMESTYAKTSTHDYFKADIIPELHTLMTGNTHFSNNDDIGGSITIDGTHFTQAGLFAQTCGAPIHLPIDANSFHPKNGFFPNAYCLYDVLRQDGYDESFVIGTNSEFAGMNRFVESHAHQKLLDTLYYKERDGLFLGFENRKKFPDKQTFENAKEELLRLGKNDKPFVLTLMTMDTHFGKRYFEDTVCQQKFPEDERIKNVVSCASYQLGSFIDWIKQQDFYKDTVVVIVGDHLTMNPFFTKDMDRKVINIFINSSVKATHKTNRTFTPFDIYPTIVESLGIKIPGHRLGLGTSLYSEIPTLTEGTVTPDEMNIETQKKSKLYDWLLYGKDIY